MKTSQVLPLTALCFAVGITIAARLPQESSPKAGDVSEARVASESSEGNNWPLNGRTFDAQHFSPLKQITDQNVGNLGLAWFLDIDSGMGIVAEPIVVDGVAYVSARCQSCMR